MESITATFPKTGTSLSYAKAIEAYDELEKAMLSKVFAISFLPNAGMNDLLQEIDKAASRKNARNQAELQKLHEAMVEFVSEHATLKNCADGQRRHLLDKPAALTHYDETHLFEVRIDGAQLLNLCDRVLDATEVPNTMQPACASEHDDSHLQRTPCEKSPSGSKDDKLVRLLMMALIVLFICLGVSMVIHSVLQIGFCSKWFI